MPNRIPIPPRPNTGFLHGGVQRRRECFQSLSCCPAIDYQSDFLNKSGPSFCLA